MLKIIFGLTTLLLVACAGASIAPEGELNPPPSVVTEAAKPDLVDPAQAIPQQADNLGDGRPVKPASIPTVANAGEESVPALPAPAGPDPVASDIPAEDVPSGDSPSGVPQSEPESAPAVKENPAEANSPPVPEPPKAPAGETKESSPRPALPLAPAFTLTSASGEQVSLETYRSESNVVLVFFRGFW